MAMDEASTIRMERKRGGWITLAFIIGTKVAVGVATYGLLANLTVFLIQQFNIPSIDATQINSVISGSSQLAPVVGAIISDAGPGCFNVISAASLASFLGTLLFMLISLIPYLRPPPCSVELCSLPTSAQLALLYIAIALILAGIGGTRFISATFGAEQFDSISERATFFNWYVMFLCVSALLAITVVVYIQNSLGWTWGFGFSVVLSAVGLIILHLGTRYYRHPKCQRNPISILLCSCVPSARRKTAEVTNSQAPLLCPSSDDLTIAHNGEEISNNDVNSLIRLVPLISTGILVNISNSFVGSLTVLQALVMDRDLVANITIPASSMLVFLFSTTILSVPLLEHAIFPVFHRLSHHRPTPLQRIGTGYFINVLSVVTAAIVESRRLTALQGSGKPMQVLWLVPGLVLAGLGEALDFPGQLVLYHQELPESLSNSATGVITLVSAIGFFASTGVVALVRRITPWLQDETNRSRLDNVYWMLAVVGALNLVYFLICAKLYKKI